MCPACQSRASYVTIPFPLQTPAFQAIRDLISFCHAKKEIFPRVVLSVVKNHLGLFLSKVFWSCKVKLTYIYAAADIQRYTVA